LFYEDISTGGRKCYPLGEIKKPPFLGAEFVVLVVMLVFFRIGF
jgi:hypothetical protein